MNEAIDLYFFSDPGHGWLAVDYDLLEKFNLHGMISGYSYRKGNVAYLEEDVDAGYLLEYLKHNLIEYNIVHIDSNAEYIRSFPRYSVIKKGAA